MAFDGIVNKAIAFELQQLSGGRVDKIYQPNLNNIIIGFYLNGNNYALNISIDPGNYRINLTTHSKKNPKNALNFCMVLRKYLLGLHIKNVITFGLERIITIEFEGFDDTDDIITKKLVIELMGKHCNVILLDESNIIIDSLRHISNEKSTHIIIPHIKYTYPKSNKLDFLSCSNFNEFEKNIKESNILLIPEYISKTYNGISKKYISFIIEKLKITNIKDIYNYLKNIISCTDSLQLKFEEYKKDYFLVNDNNSFNNQNFNLNFFLDDFYFKKESNEELNNYRSNAQKLILSTFKKYKKRLFNINAKLKECDNMDIYKLYGELITANLYRIKKKNISSIELENYYDNNNLISIPLDSKYPPNINAKRYFKKYNKLKNAQEIVTKQKQETIDELNYIESIIYELETATNVYEIFEILDEINENIILKTTNISPKKSKNKKSKNINVKSSKNINFDPKKYLIDGYTFLVGRNNKENDYLTMKFSKKNYIWFHTKDIHGCHAILVINSNDKPSNSTLLKCAQITAYNSKAKFSSNVPVDYCLVKYVKKPNGAKPGMVIYSNNSTFYVKPHDFD